MNLREKISLSDIQIWCLEPHWQTQVKMKGYMQVLSLSTNPQDLTTEENMKPKGN